MSGSVYACHGRCARCEFACFILHRHTYLTLQLRLGCGGIPDIQSLSLSLSLFFCLSLSVSFSLSLSLCLSLSLDRGAEGRPGDAREHPAPPQGTQGMPGGHTKLPGSRPKPTPGKLQSPEHVFLPRENAAATRTPKRRKEDRDETPTQNRKILNLRARSTDNYNAK